MLFSRISALIAIASSYALLSVATPTETITVPAPVSSSTEFTDQRDFTVAVLNSTNAYRKQHNASAVNWDQKLADYAQQVSDRCTMHHSGGPYGENLASGYPTTTQTVAMWGNERTQYDFSNGGFGDHTGHFTQLVWKATTAVGCARTLCDSKGDGTAPGWLVVCEYNPPGNIRGGYKANVDAQIGGQPTDQCPQGAVCSNDAPSMKRRGWAVALGLVMVGSVMSSL